ncbi:MAG TPA: DUF5663 domain-containing protein, partial [Chloroflexia bacterium]
DSQQQKLNITIPAETRSYLEALLEDADMSSFDLIPEMKEEAIQDLYVRLDNFIAIVLIDNMDPRYTDEFIKMNEQGSPQADIEQFMRRAIPNVEEVMTSAFMEFREMYLNGVKRARAAQ